MLAYFMQSSVKSHVCDVYSHCCRTILKTLLLLIEIPVFGEVCEYVIRCLLATYNPAFASHCVCVSHSTLCVCFSSCDACCLVNCRIHVRRTDKVGAEAAFHSIDEYMMHVDDYYEMLEKHQHVDRRRVYIATDDPSVIDDAKRKSVLAICSSTLCLKINITFFIFVITLSEVI